MDPIVTAELLDAGVVTLPAVPASGKAQRPSCPTGDFDLALAALLGPVALVLAGQSSSVLPGDPQPALSQNQGATRDGKANPGLAPPPPGVPGAEIPSSTVQPIAAGPATATASVPPEARSASLVPVPAGGTAVPGVAGGGEAPGRPDGRMDARLVNVRITGYVPAGQPERPAVAPTLLPDQPAMAPTLRLGQGALPPAAPAGGEMGPTTGLTVAGAGQAGLPRPDAGAPAGSDAVVAPPGSDAVGAHGSVQSGVGVASAPEDRGTRSAVDQPSTAGSREDKAVLRDSTGQDRSAGEQREVVTYRAGAEPLPAVTGRAEQEATGVSPRGSDVPLPRQHPGAVPRYGDWPGHRPAELEVHIDGGDLGPVTVWVAERHGKVAARFVVEDGNVSGLLQRNMPELQARLEQAGLVAGQLEVSLGESGYRDRRSPPDAWRGPDRLGGVGPGPGRLRAPPVTLAATSGRVARCPGTGVSNLDVLM
ncbi:MAG: flagellar hook-length control protein FliK [Bacillota bacterium]